MFLCTCFSKAGCRPSEASRLQADFKLLLSKDMVVSKLEKLLCQVNIYDEPKRRHTMRCWQHIRINNGVIRISN